MNRESSGAKKTFGGFAPKPVQLTDQVLIGDVWERRDLSKLDRSLVTVAALVELNRPDQLRFHPGRAIENGLKEPELIEVTRSVKMSKWHKDGLRRIAETDDLHISPFREDGEAYGTPIWIWSVVVDNNLYVRAYNGKSSRWYKAAIQQRAGRIDVAGMTKEVSFEPVEGTISDRIDDAYRAKYRGSPYLNPMIGARARAATVKIMPREAGARATRGKRH